MKQEYIQEAKSRLDLYRDFSRESDNLVQRLEKIETRLYNAGVHVITDMPKAHNDDNDKVLDLITQRDEIEAELGKTIEYMRTERQIIKEGTKTLSKSDIRTVILSRYIDCEDWKDVSELLFGSHQDYNDKEDSYLRRTMKLHAAALEGMAEYFESLKGQQP